MEIKGIVHDAHCCKKHGCKYGDPDCPVEFGNLPGIVCEDCLSELEEFKTQILPKAIQAFKRTWVYWVNIDGPTEEETDVFIDRMMKEFSFK